MPLPPLRYPAWILFAGLSLFAQSTPIAFTGARVIPIDGPEIANGVVVVNNGRIVSVGAAGSAIPANAQRIDVTGKVLMPGLVDSHSHVGQPEGADASSPFQPDVRVLDSVNPRAASIKRARAGGITTVNVMPGSGHLLSGQTLYLKLRDARVIDDDFDHDGSERSATIRLQAGRHPLRLHYRHGTGPMTLQLKMAGPGLPEQVVPGEQVGDGFALDGRRFLVPERVECVEQVLGDQGIEFTVVVLLAGDVVGDGEVAGEELP